MNYSLLTFFHKVVAVSGLAVSTAPNVAHYLPFFGPLVNSDDKVGAGVASTLASAVAATVFFAIAIAAIHRKEIIHWFVTII